MALYSVTDKTTQFSRGDERFAVEGGMVEMPSAIAADYVQAGILVLQSEAAPAEKPMTAAEKKAAAKAAAAAADQESAG